MRGIPGLRRVFASFRRDVMGTDSEGNPSGDSTVIWEGMGTVKREGSEIAEDSAGRPFSQQRAVFRARPSSTIRVGDYCTFYNTDWSVDSIEVTADTTRISVVSPPKTPYA